MHLPVGLVRGATSGCEYYVRARPCSWAAVDGDDSCELHGGGVDEQPPLLERSPAGGVIHAFARWRCVKQDHARAILSRSIKDMSEQRVAMAATSKPLRRAQAPQGDDVIDGGYEHHRDRDVVVD